MFWVYKYKSDIIFLVHRKKKMGQGRQRIVAVSGEVWRAPPPIPGGLQSGDQQFTGADQRKKHRFARADGTCCDGDGGWAKMKTKFTPKPQKTTLFLFFVNCTFILILHTVLYICILLYILNKLLKDTGYSVLFIVWNSSCPANK